MKARYGLVVVVLMLLSTLTWAGPFLNPPEVHWPFGDHPYNSPWVYAPEYQRDILYTFDNTLDRLKPVYNGLDDTELFESDLVEVNGLQYFPVDNITGTQRVGIWGFDNRQGEDNFVGWMRFRIDNWTGNRAKHVWKELVYRTPMPCYVTLHENITMPPGHELFASRLIKINAFDDNWLAETVAWAVEPNPPWEDIYVVAYVPVGSWIMIDQVHFATECIPEPGTVSLAILGTTTLVWLKRRRRRR